MIPLLLNFLAVFFIIAGAVLLWINLRASRRSRSISHRRSLLSKLGLSKQFQN